MSKTAFLFPGQGAQTVGMGKQLYETLPAAKAVFDQAAEILGYDLAEVCFNGPAEKLNSTVVSQPAIYVCSLAALESLKQSEPDVFATVVATAGLSLGEYTALVFAGAMSFADGLRLVQKRGQAMQEASDANPSAMVSVLTLELPKVEELVALNGDKGLLQIANFLCPGNIVVSGTKDACTELEKKVEEAGGRSVRLSVAGAFHTPLMKPADEKLAAALRDVKFQAAKVPVWSNVDAKAHEKAEDFPNLLVSQVLSPVMWELTMRNLLASGVERFYEIGPGRVLAGLLKRILRKADCKNIGV